MAGYTALHYAAQQGDIAIVQQLLDVRANMHRANARGLTALHLAAASGHLIVLQLLVGRGAQVNAVGGAGCTALHIACKEGHLPAVKLLLSCGANPAVVIEGEGGWTPLLLAVAQGHTEVVELLLRREVYSDQELERGVREARDRNYTEVCISVLRYVEKRPGDVWERCMAYLGPSQRLEVMRALIRADRNAPAGHGERVAALDRERAELELFRRRNQELLVHNILLFKLNRETSPADG